MSIVDGEVRFDPVTARQGAAYLSDAGQTLANSRGNQGGQLEDEGGVKPWGADTLGQAFQTNYDQIAPIVLEAWTKIGTYIEEYATGVTSIIDAAVAAEDAANQRMTW